MMTHGTSTTAHVLPDGQLFFDKEEARSRVESLEIARSTYDSAINDKLDRVDNIAENTIKPGISAFREALDAMLSMQGRLSLPGDDDQIMRDILEDHSDLLALRDRDASLRTVRWHEGCSYEDWRSAGQSTCRNRCRDQGSEPVCIYAE